MADKKVVPGSKKSDAGVPLTQGKGAAVTAAQAKSLGFDSPKGITVKDGQYVFDPSLAPERQGFQPVGIAKPGEQQMTPYYGDVTGAYRLNQSQYAQARASGNVSKAQLDIMRQNEINALVAQGVSPTEAATQVDSANPSYGGTSGGAGGVTGSSASGSLTGTGGPGTPEQQAARKSAYDILAEEFNRYGLGSLVEPLKGLVTENISPSEFSLRLQQTDAYKQRFAANADRIAKGLTALKPAEYLAMEDQYQNIMRNYGLPASYYSKDSLGTQAGFNQLIANDVSSAELEDRVMTAQNRVQNANPEVYKALKAFYPDITNGDVLAYALDPNKALDMIKRKVTAAEIGGAALAQGLTTDAAAAENLARYGITKQQAQQGYESVAGMLPRASQLSDIYKQDPYTQAVAEADVFGTAGSVAAKEKRRKLSALEAASFAGSSGAAQNALSRDRASNTGMYRESGAGAF
jgi:hypothetical protein